MAELDAVLDRLADGRASRPTLWGLIEGWRQLVEAVEHEYDWCVYEYFNDLNVRRALQTVVEGHPRSQGWLSEELAPLDERFRQATQPGSGDQLLRRVPRFPGPELAADLDDPDATTTL